MFNCIQCGAGTPDACRKRHAAQKALHDSIEKNRAAMHLSVDALVSRMITTANDGSLLELTEVSWRVLSAGFVSASMQIYQDARAINTMIAGWGKS